MFNLNQSALHLIGSAPYPAGWPSNVLNSICGEEPGCIASASIEGLRRSNLLPRLTSKLNIVSMGGRSYAAPGQSGLVRVGRRWLDHPHVAEIERSTSAQVASFVPVIAYPHVETGLLVVLSGTCTSPNKAEGPSTPPKTTELDVADVVGTASLKWRLDESPEGGFSLAVAIDNVTFVANLAVEGLRRILTEQLARL